jgi:hypothetical protein
MAGYFNIVAHENMCALSVCNSLPDTVTRVEHHHRPHPHHKDGDDAEESDIE